MIRKKKISGIVLLGGFALTLAGAVILSSCEGPAGPPGMDGEDGVDGVDANETCIVCHNSGVVLLAKQEQTMSSHHLTGGNYGRNHTDCAPCHTHQGFIETQASGETETANTIIDPAPINCRTCHLIHNNYDASDWGLTTSSAVELQYGDATVDLGGPENLCVNCHQSRPVNPDPLTQTGELSVTSSRYGPHHGPQGNMLWGAGAYEISGSKTYPEEGSHAHAGAGCTTCHMAEVPYSGITAGGHTFSMTYGEDGENINGCVGCHSSLEEFDYNGFQTEIEELMVQIHDIMATNGWLNENGSVNASSGTPLVLNQDQLGALLNYKTIEEDRSMGIHNPAYMEALLTNTLEFLNQ
ncbi:MAG: hypothetical protein EHM46_00710 [Bacteroidetes bacterium]|nr:MAG: hypothetical protein EHM46_00710 [Bacteroidota bacterium]